MNNIECIEQIIQAYMAVLKNINCNDNKMISNEFIRKATENLKNYFSTFEGIEVLSKEICKEHF